MMIEVSHKTRLAALLAALLAAMMLALAAKPAEAAFPGKNGKIVFASKRDGKDALYVTRADGSNVSLVPNSTASDSEPAFSPNGKKIVFRSARQDGDWEIYTMNIDGTELRRITHSPGWDTDPSWSPDGERIVFESDRDSTDRGSKHEIYVANADGSNQTRLTGGAAYNRDPVFSPDGTKIAFVRETFDEENTQYDVFVMRADGTNLVRLTNTSSDEQSPDFSPEGRKILYASGRFSTMREIYTINAHDGSNLVNITNHPADDLWPAFSPDGQKIVFVSDRNSGDTGFNSELYVANADGSGQTRITTNPGPDSWPSWQHSSNQAPTADAGGPYAVDEGGSVELAATGIDSEGGALAYAWDLDGDGTFETSGRNATFSAAHLDGPSSRTVKVRVTDAEGESATDEAAINVGNVAPTATFDAPASVEEGDAINLSLSGAADAGKADESAGFSYAFDCGDGSGYGAFGPDSAASCPTDDNGAPAVKGKVRDKDGGVSEYAGDVSVSNIAPTVTSISAPSRVVTGKSVSFAATATDPSSADTAAGFSWRWAVDGGAFSAGPNPFVTAFPTCGEHTVGARAVDKDGGVSEPVYSEPVSVYEARFQAPLDEGVYNTVQRGRVLAVRITVGCGDENLPGLSPTIQLLKGDRTASREASPDAVETYSASVAETTGVMEPTEGGYIYNLRVPKDAESGDLFTIRVRPFGDTGTSPAENMHVVLRIK